MIRAHRAKGCDALRPLISRMLQDIFKFAQFVATVRDAGDIIVFDRNFVLI
jgi:hypothetical protein